MQKPISIFLILFVVGFNWACKNQRTNSEDLPVAVVQGKYLYTSDLENVVPKGITELDSLTLVKDYIEKWVKKQLLLYQAELNLSETEKDVDDKIEEYRSSLLIFRYEQNLIQEKLDTNISPSEIENYYTENPSNFQLNHNLVKALLIKVPKVAPDIWRVRRWYSSDNEENLQELEAYCYNNAEIYDYFDEKWVPFDLVAEQIPRLNNTAENILKNRKTFEISDSLYYYFVRIYDYRLSGDVAPLEYVDDNIKSILLNKRKIQYINNLESDIYNDALNRGNFNIY